MERNALKIYIYIYIYMQQKMKIEKIWYATENEDWENLF
jgi:hypothetical protein